MLINKEKTLAIAASKAGMDEKTARKYIKLGKLPSQVKPEHTWRTRTDPFESIWGDALEFLKNNAGLEVKTLFEYFQEHHPGRFTEGQLRTLQRKVKVWKALEGPGKEVYFPQVHYPGVLSCSDFTHMDNLGVTIAGAPFSHMMFHFVLTYSNWETGTLCFSENSESLREGLQNAYWQIGKVTEKHRTDNLTAAVYSDLSKKEFTAHYQALLNHYGVKGATINAGRAHENGDVEQSHHRFKRALDQALMLRGSRDFSSIQEYKAFIEKLFKQLNSTRKERFLEELKHMKELPKRRLDDFKTLKVSVRPSSTISVNRKVYSVHSRLIGEQVGVRLYPEILQVWYAQRMIETIPRLRGDKPHDIQYRHIIDWLVRKPGAFENYRYRDDMFPTTYFRMAYDWLREKTPARASKEYLQILHLAAKENETQVNQALQMLFDSGETISSDAVKAILDSQKIEWCIQDVFVQDADLTAYDELLYAPVVEEVAYADCRR